MGNFFILIYEALSKRRVALWSAVGILLLTFSYFASKIKFEEDILSFIPQKEQTVIEVFKNISNNNHLAVMFTASSVEGMDSLFATADEFEVLLEGNQDFQENAILKLTTEDDFIDNISNFIYNHLPLLLTENDYKRLDSLTTAQNISDKIDGNYQQLTSIMGAYVSEYIFKDPLGIGNNAFADLQKLGANFNYSLVDGYIFSKDQKTLIGYIEPNKEFDSSALIDAIEESLAKVQKTNPNIVCEYFGAPAVAKYNERQIKKDTIITLNIAILVAVIFIALAFRSFYSIILLFAPVLFGALFALCWIYFLQGEMSLIAMGSGSIIFGIAFSYAIHVLSHRTHSPNIQELIKELAYPLTVGSFTTIGAFVGLTFTDSKLLQDFGLFSSLTLIGTTLFTLIVLPHMLKAEAELKEQSAFQKAFDRVSNYHIDQSKPYMIGFLLVVTGFLFFAGDVRFDSNMLNLNYMPEHLGKAEERLNDFMNKKEGESNVMFVSASKASEDIAISFLQMIQTLDSLQEQGNIISHSGLDNFVIPKEEQNQRLQQWNSYWTKEKQVYVLEQISIHAKRVGFEENAFAGFTTLLSKEYEPISYQKGSDLAALFPEWFVASDSLSTLSTYVRLTDEHKEKVYEHFNEQKEVVAVDRAYFASLMVENVSENFYFILYISGLLVFVALLLSYGRLELTLMSFLPMLISWVIILGIMSLLGIEFNIVTIILSTFIFGIGDDFNIFVMDGLQSKYSNGSEVLRHHRVAILLSALSLTIGMGALIFAKHPAMYSLGVISLIGMLVVILVSYTIQPILFRWLISSHTEKGNFPFTILSILNTIYGFLFFVTGCFILQACILTLHFIPMKKIKRKEVIHSMTRWCTNTIINSMVTNKVIKINEVQENFEKPAVIIANHQSFIDILLLLSLNKKIVMMTNSWVWNSPFFGRIVRFLDFYHSAEGYENLEQLQEKVAQGYSVVIFPEGTRTADHKIKRFHKGAFLLAEKLELDILPILIYGTGLVSSKSQPFYVKKGVLVAKILPRISPTDHRFGEGYVMKSKQIRKYFTMAYEELLDEFNRVDKNPYFKDALLKNYIYKGPVLEWYQRVKLSMEGYYQRFDELLPRSGYIVDLGCGYGAMSYMLSMLSNKRTVLGVDYDEEKIGVAQYSFSKTARIHFESGDLRTYMIPKADAYIISDVLHYIDREAQQTVIERCMQNLNAGGVLLIRDGDTTQDKKHKRTEQTEKWSTEIIKFNKIDGDLQFLSRDFICELAVQNQMQVDIEESQDSTSNTVYIIKHLI